MKKGDLKKLALLGITGGVLMSGQSFAGSAEAQSGSQGDRYIGHSCGGGRGYNSGYQRYNSTRNNDYNNTKVSESNSNWNENARANENSSNWNQNTRQSENRYYTPDSSYEVEINEFTGRPVPKPVENYKELSEQELWVQLNDETRAVYESLDAEGRALALELANQSCKNLNDCKGRNSCRTDENSCAGQGGCQGQSKGPFEDKNQAVHVAAKRMAEKRADLNQDWWK